MFEFVESVEIKAPASEVWRYIANVEKRWLPSNPEHIRLEVLDSDTPIGPGTRIAFQERVAGIRGTARGKITRWVHGKVIEGEGRAVYRYFGLPLRVREGVCWTVNDEDPVARLSARVWAEFSSSFAGRLFEWFAKRILRAVESDREHAQLELEYLKSEIESGG